MNSKHKCKECKKYFSADLETWRVMNFGRFHDEECSNAFAIRTLKKTCAKNRKKEKKAWAEKKKAVKHDLIWWKDKTQKTVNAFVRKFDEGKPCISCGAVNYRMSAGHYKAAGTHPELRYNYKNIHGQCWYNCNSNKSGNLLEYRKGLIARYGQKLVDYLEMHHELKKYGIDELKIIDKWYERKTKRLGKRS